MGSISRVVRQLSTVADDVHPDLNELVLREPGFAEHMVGIEPQLAFTGANLPLLLKGFARITNEGAYVNAYACDLNATGFFPGLNDVVPIIVDAATPGDTAYTPRCRNMGNG
jgi:phospholipid/cholesterol/gamma-HCH transport system substrate-binding protein